MNEITMSVQNGVLTITVPLDDKKLEPSQSGKMLLYGTTGGFMSVPGRPDVKVNLNVGKSNKSR